MHALKKLTHSELLEKTKTLVAEERRLLTQVLHHLAEIERRRLYAEQGYPSLFEYCVKALGYSEGASARRIAAMRLLKEMPEIEQDLTDAKLNLSSVSLFQGFLKREKKTYTKDEKREILNSLKQKSYRESEKVLAAISPESVMPQQRERVVAPDKTEIKFIADDELMAMIQRFKELTAHANPSASYAELLKAALKRALDQIDPEKRRVRQLTPASESRDVSSSRYIPTRIRKQVWVRDQGRCTYIDLGTKKRCESRYGLEMDHVIPHAHGGSSTDPENLRLLCQAHNQFWAIQYFGTEKMRLYLNPE